LCKIRWRAIDAQSRVIMCKINSKSSLSQIIGEKLKIVSIIKVISMSYFKI
jgi:hypothetical protein